MTTVRDAAFELFRERGMTTIFGNPGSTELPMLAAFPDDFSYVLGLQEAVAVGMADGFAQASGTRRAREPAHGARPRQRRRRDLQRAREQGAAARHRRPAGALADRRCRPTSPTATRSRCRSRTSSGATSQRARPTSRSRLRRRSTTRASRRAGPRSCRSRWTTGRRSSRPSTSRRRSRAGSPDARAARRAAASRRSPIGCARPSARCSWPARTSTRPAAGTPPSSSPSASACPCGPLRRPAASGIGFPEDHPAFQGVLPPAVGPLARSLAGHDLVLVAGSSVFPYYPNIPGDFLAEGTELVAITSDPDEAARAPMGDAIVADVALTLRALADALGDARRPRARPPSARPRRHPRKASRSHRARCTRRSPSCSQTMASSCSSRRRAPPALRNQLRLSRPGSYYFSAGGGLGFGLAGRAGRPARRARSATSCACSARARRSTRSPPSGRPPPTRSLSSSSSSATASTRSSSGSRRSRASRAHPASTCRRSTWPRRRAATASRRRRSPRATSSTRRSAARSRPDGPRLVQVDVAPGMALV